MTRSAALQKKENNVELQQDSSVVRAAEASADETAHYPMVGRWNLLKPIARGGMGELYLGVAAGIEGAERPCVVKLIRREHAADKSFLARFLDEARIQAQLQHPGVAQVLEAATDESGKPYVVVEFVAGRNLGDVRKRASQLGVALSWTEAIAIAHCLCEALVHVHERTDANGRPLNIVHRDMSPQNVMVAYSGDVKLIDFGTARGENRRCQTVAGIVFAKPGYVAPELAQNTPGGPPADLYALGVILWELIMGRRFLVGEPQEHLAEVAAGRRNPPAASLTNNVPLELDTVIARLTAPKVADRYESAREALSSLSRLIKRAPSLANGERSVSQRIANLMQRLYPSEPARTRSEVAQLIATYRKQASRPLDLPPSPVAAEVDDALLPGTRYRLDRELSKNPMGVVHVATHVDLGRRVALKVLPREHCDNPEFERRFRGEARSLARLRHPGVVQLHDFGVTQDGRPFYAMEFLQGRTLGELNEEEPQPWLRVVQLGEEICSALSAAHAEGIVHRDIKPANLLLSPEGHIKVIDFGIAQAEPEEAAEESGSLRLTGTPEYMAPEQIGRQPVDGRADVYALGTVLYEMLTGHLPFSAESTVALLEAKRTGTAEAPSCRRPEAGFSSTLDRVLVRALASNPDDRFATIDELKLALARARTAPLKARRRWQVAGIAAAGVLAIGSFEPLLAKQLGQPWTGWHQEARATLGLETSLPLGSTEEFGAGTSDLYAEEDEYRAHLEAPPVANTKEPAPASDHEAAPEFKQDSREQTPEQLAPLASTRTEGASAEPQPMPPTAGAPASTGSGQRSAALGEDDLFYDELSAAQSLMKRGKRGQERALKRFRELGSQHPQHVEVLEGWSKAAAKRKWWGESLRIAIRWASVDATERAQLHLARTQRLVGQRYGAIQTLERLLDKSPRSPKALAMLDRYRQK